MRELVTGRLDGSVLDSLLNLLVKLAVMRIIDFSKVRVVPGITLYANAPIDLGHTEYESPPFLRVQVCIG